MITYEQIKEFWEWCGLVLTGGTVLESGLQTFDTWLLPDGDRTFTLPIDLNNLFRWAVPKALKEIKEKWFKQKGNYLTDVGAYQELFNVWLLKIATGLNDSEALYEALKEVMKK